VKNPDDYQIISAQYQVSCNGKDNQFAGEGKEKAGYNPENRHSMQLLRRELLQKLVEKIQTKRDDNDGLNDECIGVEIYFLNERHIDQCEY
jgi:hypothetical protein